MSLYDKILGHPFVYNQIRPRIVGGIDMSPVFTRLGVQPGDTVLDVGCGTGVALDYLEGFGRYVGVDTDPIALKFARERRHSHRGQVEFHEKLIGLSDIEELKPDVVALAGLLHHIDDGGCEALLRALAASPRLRRVVSLDITFLPNRLVNNLFTILDRGQYPRDPGGYERLAERAGLKVTEGEVIAASPGNQRVSYWLMSMARA